MIAKDMAEKANYEIITDLSKKINEFKGYDSSYTNPRTGRMIVSRDGVNFYVTFEPICTTDEKSLASLTRSSDWWLNNGPRTDMGQSPTSKSSREIDRELTFAKIDKNDI